MKILVKFGVVVALLAVAGGFTQIDSPLYRNDLEPLVVTTKEGTDIEFNVAVARTTADRAQGLMYIKFLPLDQGMLFHFPRERVLSMWMKNTYIALDMWFVSKSGEVVAVVEHTTPESLQSISSKVPTSVVVEVNAGLSQLLGVTPGATLVHTLFATDEPDS